MATLTRSRFALPPAQLVLLGLWAILLFGGWIVGSPNADEYTRMPLWTKLGSSLMLAIAAWLWYVQGRERGGALQRLTLGLAVGMSLSTLGDLFMAELIIPGDNAVLGGMGAFGLAHIAYVSGLWGYGTRMKLTRERNHALIAWWIVALLAWLFVVWLPSAERGVMHVAALPYGLLLASTAGVSTGLAINRRVFVGLAIGAALFLLSDFILAGEVFKVWRFSSIGDLIWLTYGPGQMLIVTSAAVALAEPA